MKKIIVVAIVFLILLAIFGFMFLFFNKKTTETEDLPKFTIKTDLSVEVKGSDVMATLTFSNTSNELGYIAKDEACLGGKIITQVFQVTSEDGTKISPTGLLVARPSFPRDFQEIKPGESVSTTVRLNDKYNFLPGKHTYKIKYSADHVFSNFVMLLESNEVTAQYDGVPPFVR